MADWKFVVEDLASGDRNELTAARNRGLTIALRGGHDASFEISGRHAEATLLGDLTTDLIVWRDDTRLFRGRISAPEDNLEANSHATTVKAGCYKQRLSRLNLQSVQSFTTTDQGQIAWDLVSHVQAQTGGDQGITRGAGQTHGITRTVDLPAGKSATEAIDLLAELDDGFDWDINPALELDLYQPQRGSAADLVLDYGGTVRTVRRTPRVADFANAWRVTGGGATTAETRAAAGLASAPEGRWDRQAGYTDVEQQAILAAKADYLLAEYEDIPVAYSVTLRPGRWTGPDDLWVGDTAQLVVQSGRLDVVTTRRVHELRFDVDDSGHEVVTATLGAFPPDAERELAGIARRIRQLERG